MNMPHHPLVRHGSPAFGGADAGTQGRAAGVAADLAAEALVPSHGAPG